MFDRSLNAAIPGRPNRIPCAVFPPNGTAQGHVAQSCRMPHRETGSHPSSDGLMPFVCGPKRSNSSKTACRISYVVGPQSESITTLRGKPLISLHMIWRPNRWAVPIISNGIPPSSLGQTYLFRLRSLRGRIGTWGPYLWQPLDQAAPKL